MKVLQITNSLNIGGAEKLISEMIPHFVNRGIPTDLLILKKSKTFLYERLKDKGVKVDFLSKGSVYNPLLIFKIIPYLKKYDLIHIHLFPALYWVVIAKFISFSKTKLVYTEHSTSNRRRDKKVLKYIDRLLYRRLTRIVAISEKVKSNLELHLKMTSESFEIIPNGVDLSYFATAKPSADLDRKVDDFTLIQVSSFRRPKDQHTLIKSMVLLPSNIKLILVGEGELRSECESLAKSLGLDGRIIFLGVRNDVPELILASDIAILSSFYEGLSLSSIEGMACKPFIATDAPGLKEIVEGYGLIFKPSDAEDLAKNVLSLFSDKNYYQKINSRCNLRAQEFDIGIMIDRYIRCYKAILPSHP